jgi:sulfatase-modifying factor enzyme 1
MRALAWAITTGGWALASLALGAPPTCPPDSVAVGPTCVDRYEASVWQVSPANTVLVKKIKRGKATLADLTGAGAIQLSAMAGFSPPHLPIFPANFPPDGHWTPEPGSTPPSPGVYAVSIPGVLPSHANWYRAEQACALSGKRLLTSEEWQRAAAGTPEPGMADDHATSCATMSPGPVKTGSRSNCVSSWGALDMVGNAPEWVADRVPFNSLCGPPGWPGCASTPVLPGTPVPLSVGGGWWGGQFSSALSVYSATDPADTGDQPFGFRCGR